MSYARKEFRELRERAQARKVQDRARELRAVAMAAPAMERLTGDERWDAFLKILQRSAEEAEAALVSRERTLAQGPDCSHEGMLTHKVEIAVLRGRLGALREVMELPGRLAEDARKAAELLRTAEAAEESS